MCVCVCVCLRFQMFSHLGDVSLDALGQLNTRLPKELGQVLGDVLVLVQRVEQPQTAELLGDALALHLANRNKSVSQSISY